MQWLVDWGALVIALASAVFTTWFTIKGLRQGKVMNERNEALSHRIHAESHLLAQENFDELRFDGLFVASEKLLESFSEFKSDLNDVAREPESDSHLTLDAAGASAATAALTRSLEIFLFRRRMLSVALAGIKTSEEESSRIVEKSQNELRLLSEILRSCAFAVYLAYTDTKAATDAKSDELAKSADAGQIREATLLMREALDVTEDRFVGALVRLKRDYTSVRQEETAVAQSAYAGRAGSQP